MEELGSIVNNVTFAVIGLQPFTNYTFRVRGVNDAGNGDYTNLFLIQTTAEAPEVPGNVHMVSATSQTITVSWNAISTYGPNFCYDVDLQQNNGGAVPVGTVNNEMFTVMGLQPFTNYTFRVRGVNDAGNGDYTSPITIQTTGEAPSSIPNNVMVLVVTSRTIRVSWDAIDNSRINGLNFRYGVDFQRSDGGQTPVGRVNGVEFIVEELQPFTNYTFRVRGVNDLGNGNYTELKRIQTNQEAPSEVSDNVVVATTSRTIRVTWDAISFNGLNFRYEVDLQRINGSAVTTGTVNKTTFFVEGLQPFTSYTFRVRGVNAIGSGAYTQPRTIQTNPEAPSEVPSNVVANTTSRTISVSWDAIDSRNKNGPNFRYEVKFQRMDGRAVPVGTVDNEMFTVEGLQPFTNYTFRVRGVNDAGNGDYTTLIAIQTGAEAPSDIPNNVMVLVVTSRTIRVSWGAIDDSYINGPNFHYNVDFQRSDGRRTSVGRVNGVEFIVEELQPFTNYTFRVRGVNDFGNGNYTELRRIQTNQEGSKNSAGAIAGLVVGVIVVSGTLIILIPIIVRCTRRKKIGASESMDHSVPSHPQVITYLRPLDNTELRELGIQLGLAHAHINRMAAESLCSTIAHSWLRKDDHVLTTSGEPSWESLANTLEQVGMTGVAKNIRNGQSSRPLHY